MPLWVEDAFPYLEQYLRLAVDTVEGLTYALGELLRLGKEAVVEMIG